MLFSLFSTQKRSDVPCLSVSPPALLSSKNSKPKLLRTYTHTPPNLKIIDNAAFTPSSSAQQKSASFYSQQKSVEHERPSLLSGPGQFAVVEVRVHLLSNVLCRRPLTLSPDLVGPRFDPDLVGDPSLVGFACPWVHEPEIRREDVVECTFVELLVVAFVSLLLSDVQQLVFSLPSLPLQEVYFPFLSLRTDF